MRAAFSRALACLPGLVLFDVVTVRQRAPSQRRRGKRGSDEGNNGVLAVWHGGVRIAVQLLTATVPSADGLSDEPTPSVTRVSLRVEAIVSRGKRKFPASSNTHKNLRNRLCSRINDTGTP